MNDNFNPLELKVGDIWLCDEIDMVKVTKILTTEFDRSMHADSMSREESGDSPANVINVHGPLFPRESEITRFFGVTTYQGIDRQLDTFKAEYGEGATVYLDVDSGGGNGSLLFELCHKIQTCGLNVEAYVSGRAASAAYVIAGACNKIYMQRTTAEVGCLGVMTGFVPDEAKPKNLVLSRFATHKVPSKDDTQSSADILEDKMYRHLWEWVGDKDVSYDLEKVADRFGNGRMFYAEEAGERKMVNEAVDEAPYKYIQSDEGALMPNYTEKELADKLADQKTQLQADFDKQLGDKSADAVKTAAAEITKRYDHLLSLDAGKANPEEACRFAKDIRFSLDEAETFLKKLETNAVQGKDTDDDDALGKAIKNNGGSANLSQLKDEKTDKEKADEKAAAGKAPVPKYGSLMMDNAKLATGEFEGGHSAYMSLWGDYLKQQEEKEAN